MNKYLISILCIFAFSATANAVDVWKCEKMDYSSSASINKWKVVKEKTLTSFSFSVSGDAAFVMRGENSPERVDIISKNDNQINMIIKYTSSTEIFTIMTNVNTLIYAKTGVDISQENGLTAFGHANCKHIKE